MNHRYDVESGHSQGVHVFWVRCSCGYIGKAASSDERARQETRREHPER